MFVIYKQINVQIQPYFPTQPFWSEIPNFISRALVVLINTHVNKYS